MTEFIHIRENNELEKFISITQPLAVDYLVREKQLVILLANKEFEKFFGEQAETLYKLFLSRSEDIKN